MKPADKAVEIFDFYGCNFDINGESVQKINANNHVDSIINALEAFGYDGSMYDDYETGGITTTNEKDPCAYWRDVKKELEKL